MAKTTTNLGLIKPERSDNYSVDVMGENMDIIDAKITELEAGEFESVSANLLYGKRVGTPTITQPKFWSKAIPCNFTAGLLHTNGSGTSTFTVDTTSFFSWDEIVNDDVIDYTCTYTASGDSYYYSKSAEITFTNVLTGEILPSTTVTLGKSNKTFTLSAPLLSNITVVTTGNGTMWNTTATSKTVITRPNVYLTAATL